MTTRLLSYLFFLCLSIVSVLALSPSMPRFSAALFDMDGTLLDSEKLGCKAVYLTFENDMSDEARRDFRQRDFLMPWDLKQQSLGLPGPQWAPIVLESAQKHWGVAQLPSVEEFLATWDDIMQDHMHTVQACKGASDLVASLAGRLPMAIATSSHRKSMEQKRLKHEDIFQHFDVIVTGDDPAIESGKPAPDIYLEAARRLGVDPKDCIVFEDGMPGVQAGKAAGCFVVAVPDSRFTANERKDFENIADLVLEDLTQFDTNMILQEETVQ